MEQATAESGKTQRSKHQSELKKRLGQASATFAICNSPASKTDHHCKHRCGNTNDEESHRVYKENSANDTFERTIAINAFVHQRVAARIYADTGVGQNIASR